MGCGCKNKNNGQTQAQPVNATVVNTQQQQNNETVKGSVQKIIEKYYSKK